MPVEPLRELARCAFPGQAAAVGLVRMYVCGVLDGRCPALDDVLVLVSEVASNAIKHTSSGDGGAFEVTVSVRGPSVRVEIGDQGGPSEPKLPSSDGEAAVLTGGRGLRIVDVLADRWGHAGDELGRLVWFEVTAKPDEWQQAEARQNGRQRDRA